MGALFSSRSQKVRELDRSLSGPTFLVWKGNRVKAGPTLPSGEDLWVIKGKIGGKRLVLLIGLIIG